MAHGGNGLSYVVQVWSGGTYRSWGLASPETVTGYEGMAVNLKVAQASATCESMS